MSYGTSFPPGEQRELSMTSTFGGTGGVMTQEAIEAAALADLDAQPLTEADVNRMERTPQVKVIRRALGLEQEDFASRFRIPIEMLRDWEEGRSEPDQLARAFLKVIASDPDHVGRILSPSQTLAVLARDWRL